MSPLRTYRVSRKKRPVSRKKRPVSRKRCPVSRKKCTVSKKKYTVAKTYVVLKSSKILKSKPIAKQGKVFKMKAPSSTVLAAKYALAVYRKTKRKLKSLYLYRRGNITRMSIKFKAVDGKTPVLAKDQLCSDEKVVAKEGVEKEIQEEKVKTCRKVKRKVKTLPYNPGLPYLGYVAQWYCGLVSYL